MKRLENKKMCQYHPEGAPTPRVYRRKGKFYRILVKCGDCDKKIEIYPDPREGDGLIEIGGVLAHKRDWQRIFKEAGII